jgi:hypothetical protein
MRRTSLDPFGWVLTSSKTTIKISWDLRKNTIRETEQRCPSKAETEPQARQTQDKNKLIYVCVHVHDQERTERSVEDGII